MEGNKRTHHIILKRGVVDKGLGENEGYKPAHDQMPCCTMGMHFKQVHLLLIREAKFSTPVVLQTRLGHTDLDRSLPLLLTPHPWLKK